jgi:outer membrane receptor protein involved in Fe transport
MQRTGSASPVVTNSPKHLVQARLSVPVIKRKVFASSDLQYVSKRATLAGPNVAVYVVPNFTLSTRNVLNRWEISASVYNGFNRRYADPSGNRLVENTILQDGRTVRIKVGYRFR